MNQEAVSSSRQHAADEASEDAVPDERDTVKQFNLLETKRKLKEIFTFYASYGDRLNTTHLKSHKFHKMLADAGLISASQGAAAVAGSEQAYKAAGFR